MARQLSWRRRSPVLIMVVALALITVAAACVGPQSSTNLPPVPPTIDVTMNEYRYDFAHNIPKGQVVIRVHNAGQLPHEMQILRLPEDLPPLDEQLRGSERRPVSPVARVGERQAGADGIVAVNLAPGRYGFVCFLKDPDGQQHSTKGMTAEFRVA